MNFDDLKNRLIDGFKQIWERLEESSAYNHLRDRFENLSPRAQKLALVGSALLIALLIFTVPFKYWEESQVSVKNFEDRRDIVRRLLKASREAAEVPDIPQAPTPDALKSQVEAYFTEIQLMPTQVKSIDVASLDTNLIPASMAQGSVAVNLSKLNLRQIVSIGARLRSISPSVKMTAMQVFPNAQDARYFDVNFRLSALAVPQIAAAPIPEPEDVSPKKPGFRRPKASSSKTEKTDTKSDRPSESEE